MLHSLALLAAALLPQAPAPPRTFFYVGAYPNSLFKLDPLTDQVVAKLEFLHGVAFGSTLSFDKRSLFQITGQRNYVEVADLETMRVRDAYTFEEPGWLNRVGDVREIPGGKRIYVQMERVERKLDSYVVAEEQWVEYDLEHERIEQRMPELPKALKGQLRPSQDGKEWYVYDKDLHVLDPSTLEETGLIELSKPLYWGLGAISLRGEDLFDYRDPKAMRFLYSMRDPVQKNRTLFGLVDIDLAGRKVAGITEWGAQPRAGRWLYSQDKKLAVGMTFGGRSQGGGQAEGVDPELTLMTIDLTNGKKLRETRIPVRNGLYLGAISPDGSKIYLTGRGHEIVVHGADHQYLKTIEVPGEIGDGILSVTN